MEDFFKPLYKSHKRVKFDDLVDVFDPQVSDTLVEVCGYKLRKENSHKWVSPNLPGLSILTGFLDTNQQRQLIKESLTDFLTNPEHLTNLDAHYELRRPIHMFSSAGASASQLPESSPSQTNSPALVRNKLRWITLGGQYNWTTKVYPSFNPGTPGCPHFPESLTSQICRQLGLRPEAAIVNFYSEGDILSPHQDVAELANRDLISISLGCTCIFYIALDRYGCKPLPILLHSGDVVIMGGESRFAFHGVGRVFGGSTPSGLCDIEKVDPESPAWLKDHRININVRQMHE